MMSQLERGVDAADAGNATIRASRGRRTAERQRRRGNQRSKEELRSSTAQRFRSTALFLTSWKPSLLATIKSLFRLLRNSGKKSTANQTGLSRVSLLFEKDLPQVTIGLYARSVMALQHQRLVGWCPSHPLDCHIVARVGLIDRVVSDRRALAVRAGEGNDDLAGPAILRAASLERGTAQPVAVLENAIHRFPSRS